MITFASSILIAHRAILVSRIVSLSGKHVCSQVKI
jgi:hypothetical protein